MGGGNSNVDLRGLLTIIQPVELSSALLDPIRHKFPNLEIEQHTASPPSSTNENNSTIAASIFTRTTILYTLFTLPANPAADAPNLRWVHFSSAGSDVFVQHPIYTDSDAILTTSSGVHGPQIGEWVMMTALVQSHAYNTLRGLQQKHDWNPKARYLHATRDMVGQRVGILGYGSIGRQVARLVQAMGSTVLAYTASRKDTKESRRDPGYVVPGTGDPDGDIPDEWFSGLDKEGLHQFLGQDLDMVVVSVPLTKQTRHLLGADEFAILGKCNALVTNVSRGPIVDQDALIAALKNGTLRGACLDVTDPEPLPKDNPLWDLPNVVLTPHISGLSAAYMQRSCAILERNLESFARGETMINVIDRKRGY